MGSEKLLKGPFGEKRRATCGSWLGSVLRGLGDGAGGLEAGERQFQPVAGAHQETRPGHTWHGANNLGELAQCRLGWEASCWGRPGQEAWPACWVPAMILLPLGFPARCLLENVPWPGPAGLRGATRLRV